MKMKISKRDKYFVVSLVSIGLICCLLGLFVSPVHAANPTFGNTVNESGTYGCDAVDIGGYFQMGSTSGKALSIMAYCAVTTTAHNAQCAIYDSSKNRIGLTNMKSVPVQGVTWTEFTFSTPVSLTASAYYWLAIGSANPSGDLLIYKNAAGGGGINYDDFGNNSEYTPKNPGMANVADADGKLDIYCIYTRIPTVSLVGPGNGTTGISLLNRTSVAVADIDANTLTVCFWNNKTGSWVKAQQNSTTNGTVRDMSSAWANTASTKYWWKVTVADAAYNVSAIYHFTTASNWTNRVPTISVVGPGNGTTGIARYNRTSVYVADSDGNATTVCFWNNKTGSWVKAQQNNSVAANTTVRDMVSAWASTASTKYWWKVTVKDAVGANQSVVFYFTTALNWTNRAPVLSVPGPANGSVAQNRYHMLNITVSDADGNITTVTWYTNASGGWVDYQVNNSFPANTTCRDINASWCSSYSTRYWWKIVAYDGWTSTQAIYYFTTRAAPSSPWSNRAPTFGLITPANNSIDKNRFMCTNITVYDLDGNATTVCFWNNVSGSWLKVQQNNSVVANSTVRDMVSGYAVNFTTRYWWKVTAKDATVNSSVVNNFMTRNESSGGSPDEFWVQAGFDAANIFLFIWLLLCASILFGKNVYQWFVASLGLLVLTFLFAAALIPVAIYAYFTLASVFVALIGFIKTLNRFMSEKEE